MLSHCASSFISQPAVSSHLPFLTNPPQFGWSPTMQPRSMFYFHPSIPRFLRAVGAEMCSLHFTPRRVFLSPAQILICC